MRLLLEEYEQGKNNFYIHEEKEEWMEKRIATLYRGDGGRNLKLSAKAQKTIKRLQKEKMSHAIGYIGAVDPYTGEVFYGKTVIEASKLGRKALNNPEAVFYFVRVGSSVVETIG
jgi:hypothetical protein